MCPTRIVSQALGQRLFILDRGQAILLGELVVEGLAAGIATHVGDAPYAEVVVVAQQLGGILHPQIGHVVLVRQAGVGLEEGRELVLRHLGGCGDVGPGHLGIGVKALVLDELVEATE